MARRGNPSSYIEYSPKTIKRIKKRKAAQERRWAAKSGPVIIKQKPVDNQ